MEDDKPPPPSSPPMGRLSDLSKQPSYFGRWLAGAQEPQDKQQQQQQQQRQQRKRPSLLGFFFDNGDSNNNGPSAVDTTELDNDSSRKDAKENLIRELTFQLEECGKQSFTLTSKDVRLLLDLPEKKSLSLTRAGSDSGPCPPPIKPLPVQSSLFDSWDFTSTDELSGDEIQAIMIALEANQLGGSSLAVGNDGNSNNKEGLISPPALISNNARQVSIQKLDSRNGPQYLVSLGDIDGNEVPLPPPPPPPPPPSLPLATDVGHSTDTEDKYLSSMSTCPISLKPGLARQFSIQPFPSEGKKKTLTGEKPAIIKARQVSVQALSLSPKGSTSNNGEDEESAAVHYVISLPETGVTDCGSKDDNDNNASPEKRSSRLVRKVSVQPTLSNSIDNKKDTSPPLLKKNSAPEGFRSVSVRMNGGQALNNFQLGPL